MAKTSGESANSRSACPPGRHGQQLVAHPRLTLAAHEIAAQLDDKRHRRAGGALPSGGLPPGVFPRPLLKQVPLARMASGGELPLPQRPDHMVGDQGRGQRPGHDHPATGPESRSVGSVQREARPADVADRQGHGRQQVGPRLRIPFAQGLHVEDVQQQVETGIEFAHGGGVVVVRMIAGARE